MSKLRWLIVLMVITILGITGFQLYWLRENYSREEKALAIKSEITFRETIQELQVKKLRLWETSPDSLDTGNVKIFMSKDGGAVKVTRTVKDNALSRINVIREKLKDSINRKKLPGRMVFSIDNATVNISSDSPMVSRRGIPGPPNPDHIFQLLYGVDSLQDSLRLQEIDTAYRQAMKDQQLNVPFTIYRLDSVATNDEPGLNEVTVGFAHPVTYRMELGNTLSYLMRRISMPILFSIVLLGITLLSFVLLYRNLLRQQRLAELKNEFISNITHELKTPIATVGVAIEALKNFNAIQDPQRTREYLDISSNELHRLGLLVDKVLKLSLFEKTGIELKYERLDLEELVNEVLTSLKLQLEKYKADVNVTRNGDLHLEGDRLHLLSVIFNLLDNSLKYRDGNPVIGVDMKGRDQDIELTISDNGIGIPPEYRQKIFEKFFRVPHGDTHNAKGYGLGLSYAAQVIRKHKGTIHCESQAGGGTVFTITLPKQHL